MTTRSRPKRPLTTWLVPTLLAVAATGALTACGDDSPERPGAPLEVDGESPTITDPGGVANDLTDLTED
ncbi:MAG: hypothetical protein R8G01_17960 [Ilumatobacteraceae bacterium]|nr:hypothetical protein [Ilumatobacteraceae bacterium]